MNDIDYFNTYEILRKQSSNLNFGAVLFKAELVWNLISDIKALN